VFWVDVLYLWPTKPNESISWDEFTFRYNCHRGGKNGAYDVEDMKNIYQAVKDLVPVLR
jgi:hypothetical protein